MDAIDVLEKRIAELERKLMGNADATTDKRRLVQELVEINNKLNTVIGNRNSIKEAFGKLKQLRQCTDPIKADQLSMPLDAKLKVIECNAANVEKTAHQMHLIEQSQSILDSEHIRAAPTHGPKLTELGQKQTQLAEQVASHTSEVSDLIKTYNQLVLQLNKQFTFWDQQLTKIEIEKANA